MITWRTISKYVDLQTGEELTKKQVEEEYIILGKKKNIEYEHKYINRQRKTFGTTTITNECTKNGKQIRIW